MKLLIAALIFTVTGCSTSKIKVKNCKAIGSNLYECEMLSDNQRVK